MRNLQGPSHRVFNEYERLQNKIQATTGVECSVLINAKVSIKVRDYFDFLLAKKAIKDDVQKEIIWTKAE